MPKIRIAEPAGDDLEHIWEYVAQSDPEAANKLIIAYSSKDGGGNILYRWSPLGTISLSPEQTLIAGKINNVTTAKSEFTDDIVFLAEGGGLAKGVKFHFDNAPTV